MSQTIYTNALARAVQLEGSMQSIAHLLRVPESTLQRWMSGRAQMPLQAFLKLISLIVQHEKQIQVETRSDATSCAAKISPDGIVTLKMGPLAATCIRCDGTEFTLALRDEPLRYVSELVCLSCGAHVVYGNLVAQLAKDLVHKSRASNVARTRLLEKSVKQVAREVADNKRLRED